MTKRSKSICTILAIILMVLLEVSTMKVMKYNTFLLIVSAVLYFANLVFLVIDAYFTFKKGFSKYYFFLTIRDTAILEMQVGVYYLLGNMQGMKTLELAIIIALTVIFCYIAIKFGKLANKICPHVYVG